MASTYDFLLHKPKLHASLCYYRISLFMFVVTTHKYGCKPNCKQQLKNYLLSYVEDYWPTSIIYHNRLPIFHSFHVSCFSTTSKLVHHYEPFGTFYKKLIVILQKYNLGNLPYNCYTNQVRILDIFSIVKWLTIRSIWW